MRGAQFAFLNSDGIVFKATNPLLMGHYFNPITQERQQQIISSKQLGNLKLPTNPLPVVSDKDPPFFEFIFDEQVQIASQVYIPSMRLSLVGYSQKETFFGSAVRHFLFIYAIYGLILLVGGAVTYWLSIWISRPLRQLIHIMGEVRQGNLGVRFKEAALGFEINMLGNRFNTMIHTLLFNMGRAEDERVKKEAYQREVEICREVQKSLISFQMPSIESARVSAFYLPAIEVGADFYYFFYKTTQEKENVLAFIVADVVGRGISPCLYALSARSLLRAYSTLHDDVGTILRLTNNDFINDMGGTSEILNLCLGLYHTESRILYYCLCGGVMGIIKKKNGHMTMLKQTGVRLGSEQLYNYQSESVKLDSGDTLILYTRGLFKMTNPQQTQFSEKQLEIIVQSPQWNTTQDFINALTTTIQEFTQGTPQEEEVVIVALKVD